MPSSRSVTSPIGVSRAAKCRVSHGSACCSHIGRNSLGGPGSSTATVLSFWTISPGAVPNAFSSTTPAARHHRLRPLQLVHRELPRRELRRDAVEDLRVKNQLQPERLRHRLARHVVRGRPQPARDDDQVRAAHRLLQHLGDRHAVRHRHLPLDPQPQPEQPLGQKTQVGIRHHPQQQFRPRIDHLDAHPSNMGDPRRLSSGCPAWPSPRRRSALRHRADEAATAPSSVARGNVPAPGQLRCPLIRIHIDSTHENQPAFLFCLYILNDLSF